MTPHDITPGESWGCRYRTTKMLDKDGKPVKNLQIGETAAGPGPVEGVAIIKTRDIANQRLELVDMESNETVVVSFDDVWDVDRVVISED